MLPCSTPMPLLCFLRQHEIRLRAKAKPAMFAQTPLSEYRHFTGAVCTTSSSDGRFMGMIAFTGLSSSLTGVAVHLAVPPLSRYAHVRGLVALRQTFVRRCQQRRSS